MKLGQEEDKRGGRALSAARARGGVRGRGRGGASERGVVGGGRGGSDPARRMRVDVSAVPLGCGE